MTLVTRDTDRQLEEPPVLTRTGMNTVAWVLRTAVTPARPTTRRSSARAPGGEGPISLVRTREQTVRWFLRAGAWGPILLIAGIAVSLAAAAAAGLGIWVAIPHMEGWAEAALIGAKDVFAWLIESLGAFPEWLESLFAVDGT